MKKLPVTAIILAKNEESMLPGCLKTLSWCKEIIMIDDGSTDKTAEIAESTGVKVISFKHQSFARRREEGAKYATQDWLFYVDSDERVTPQLAQEIQVNLENHHFLAFQLNRENIFFGKLFLHGGWETDTVTRLIKVSALRGWRGDIHESPLINGKITTLKSPLLHFSHRSVVDGLYKSASWTPIEAQLIAKAKNEQVGFMKVVKKGLAEFWRRAVKNKGYQDGEAGMMESLVQAINRMLVYLQVWELQQTPPIKDLYAVKEREVEILWEQVK